MDRIGKDIGSSEAAISDPYDSSLSAELIEIDYPTIFDPSRFDRLRATRDRNGLLRRLDGSGHDVFAARIAERHIWYGNGRAAKALIEASDHPLAHSVRARAAYLLGDVFSASSITDRLLASTSVLTPLVLEARLLSHETCGLHEQYVTEDLWAALTCYSEALSLARALRMPHKRDSLLIRIDEIERALRSEGRNAPAVSSRTRPVGDRPDPARIDDRSQGTARERLERAHDHFRKGKLGLAKHEFGSPPDVGTGRDEVAWWSCLALQLLAVTGDAAMARPRLAFEMLAQLRARRPSFAMERSHRSLVESLLAEFPLGLALAVSHPEFADWRYAVRFLPIVHLEDPVGIFVNGRRVVTINWRVREDLVALTSEGRTFLSAMRYGARPGRDREWRRLLRERLPRAGLSLDRLCSAAEYGAGLAALQRALPKVPFADVVTPALQAASDDQDDVRQRSED